MENIGLIVWLVLSIVVYIFLMNGKIIFGTREGINNYKFRTFILSFFIVGIAIAAMLWILQKIFIAISIAVKWGAIFAIVSLCAIVIIGLFSKSNEQEA